MPCFHVHWWVALSTLGDEPKYLMNGFKNYKDLVKGFSDKIDKRLQHILQYNDEKAAEGFCEFVKNQRIDFDNHIRNSPDYDDITCFSAYTLGACGPDFWMCFSVPPGDTIPDHADMHFDLGHYNRTHLQFVRAIENLQYADKNSLQSKLKISYFLGMATHIAADCIVHQLVNVTAGAYNLLEKRWWPEYSNFKLRVFNTHNKVEHYWDTYVRHYLLATFFGIPTIERLKLLIESDKDSKVKKKVISQVDKEDTRLNLELPFIFPFVFADRMIEGGIRPFIYDVVVKKETGAYRQEVFFGKVYSEVIKEARSYQMQDKTPSVLNEKKKLGFFSTASNIKGIKSYLIGVRGSNMNYLTYEACPHLDRVMEYLNLFYDIDSLGPFMESGISLALRFYSILLQAFENGSTFLGDLGKFWNLDTGLGLVVRTLKSKTTAEIITQLDFVHAFSLTSVKPLEKGYKRSINYIYNGIKPQQTYQTGWDNNHPFKIYHHKPFPSINEVEESGADDSFLKTILLDGSTGALASDRKVDNFFSPVPKDSSLCKNVPTSSIQEECKLKKSDIKHRLTLAIRVPNVDTITDDLAKPLEKLGFFLWGDQALKLDDALKEEPSKWMKDEKTKCIDYSENPLWMGDRLNFFKTELAFNLEKDKDLKRKKKKGEWNNVIPYDESKKYYGRNFAVGTGRTNVLVPTGSFGFNPVKDFSFYGNISPTEQVFFSLYILLNASDGCFDMISKEPVSKVKSLDLEKIESVGVVKIVLFYILSPDGAMYLKECFIDGETVPVDELDPNEDIF